MGSIPHERDARITKMKEVGRIWHTIGAWRWILESGAVVGGNPAGSAPRDTTDGGLGAWPAGRWKTAAELRGRNN